jgi:meso-butanediol dehydrogenase/(S,S)-butanediol dehydrogenase/diacetyl reductase
MSQRFAGKRVFLSGAAAGMGRATALKFAAEGARVYCTDLDQKGVEQTVADIAAAGGEAHAGALDVSQGDSCREAIASAVATLGGIDILCNIAGMGGLKPFEQETDEGWRKVMAVNADGPFFLSRAAMPELLANKGVIVNVASTAGVQGQAYMAAYVASKHAVVGLTKTLALEFGRRGVRVNALCPGGTKTGFLKGFQLDDSIDLSLVGRTSLMEEMAEPEDMANSICFLASEDARFANGAVLSIDGGSTAG